MKSKKGRILLASIVGFVLFGGLAIGATYALFSDSATVNSHIQAGTLQVGFKRTALVGTKIDETGSVVDFTNNDVIDLKESEDDIFAFESAVPTLYQEATLEVENLGTLAFNYSIKFDENVISNYGLEDQLYVTVTHEDKVITEGKLGDLLAQDELTPIDTLAAGSKDTFNVKVEFLDHELNNNVKADELTFDFTLYCEQITK